MILLILMYASIIDSLQLFQMIEETPQPKTEKFQKVQQKLNLLAQSKLQNLSQNVFKVAQERLNAIEKKLAGEITSNQKIIRDYRLKLRSFSDQFMETEEKCTTSMQHRSAQIRSLRQELNKILAQESEGRSEKQKWSQFYSEENIEKTEKQVEQLQKERKYQIGSLNQRLIKTIPEERDLIQQASRDVNQLLDKKMDGVSNQCNELRQCARKELERGQKAEKKIVQHLKGVVAEIKMNLSDEKLAREKNRDRLVTMLQQATKSLTMK